MKTIKKLLFFTLIFLIISGSFVWWSNYKVEKDIENLVTFDISKVPTKKVGLLLGTGKTLRGGRKNLYFFYRIDATEKLYKSGKIQYILISGDNSQKDYSEPEDMQAELIARGIPKDKIFLDFAGFRTLDSVVRAKEIFGQNSFIVISQKFHNQRAIFLAQHYGIDAFGYNAQDVNKNAGFKTNLREKFARAKVFIDLLFGKKPKFDGEKVVIP